MRANANWVLHFSYPRRSSNHSLIGFISLFFFHVFFLKEYFCQQWQFYGKINTHFLKIRKDKKWKPENVNIWLRRWQRLKSSLSSSHNIIPFIMSMMKEIRTHLTRQYLLGCVFFFEGKNSNDLNLRTYFVNLESPKLRTSKYLNLTFKLLFSSK